VKIAELQPIAKESLTTVRKIISQQIKIQLSKYSKEWLSIDNGNSIIRQQINYDQIKNDYLSFTIILKFDTGTIILMNFVIDAKTKMAVSDYVVKVRNEGVTKSTHPKKVPATSNLTMGLVESTFDKISEILRNEDSSKPTG
jgi:hypothetical protein